MISIVFKGKPLNITAMQVYASNSNTEEAEVEWFFEDLQDLLELTPKKDVLFNRDGLECKNRKSRDTWSNRQIWSESTEWSRAKANTVLPRDVLVIANTLFQQYRRQLYIWTSPDRQYQNLTDYILCSQRWRWSIQSAKTRPGADCGSDHEFIIAKFRVKLKKGKATTIQVWPISNSLWLYSGSEK